MTKFVLLAGLVSICLGSCEKVQPLLVYGNADEHYRHPMKPIYPLLDQNSSYIEVVTGRQSFYLRPEIVFEEPTQNWYRIKGVDTTEMFNNTTIDFSFSLLEMKTGFFVLDSTDGRLRFDIRYFSAVTELPSGDTYGTNINTHYKGLVEILKMEPIKVHDFDAMRISGTAYVPVKHLMQNIRTFFTVKFNNVIVLAE